MGEGCSNWTSIESAMFFPCNATQNDKEMVFRISFGFGIVSLLGVLGIIGHAVAKRLYFSSEVRPILHLSIATAGFCACLIILSSFYLFSSQENIEKAAIYVTTLEEVFYLVSFFLTANYTIVVYFRLRNELNVSEENTALETLKTTKRIIRLSYQISWMIAGYCVVMATIQYRSFPTFAMATSKSRSCPVTSESKINIERAQQTQLPCLQHTLSLLLKDTYLKILPPLLLVPVTVAVVTRPVKIKLCPFFVGRCTNGCNYNFVHRCPSVLYYPSESGTAFDNDFLKNFGFILVIASYGIVVIIILVLFTLSWRICSKILNRKSTGVSDNTSVRWLRMRMSLYILGFFYCWTPTFVIAILILVDELQKLTNCASLFYVWAVTATCQGLILAIIYFYSIFYQTTQSQFRRGKRPFGSRIYRFYGTGSQRSRYPKVRTPSPSLSDGSQVGDTNANVGALSPTTTSSSGNKKNQRSPSFLGLLKNQENELTEGDVD